MTIQYRNATKNSTNVRVKKSITAAVFQAAIPALYRVCPPAARALVRQLFFKPKRYKPMDIQTQRLRTACPGLFRSDGRDLRYWKIGTPPWMLFNHGWAGSGVQFEAFFDPFLDAGYGVIFFDNPGHGASGTGTGNYFNFSNAVYHLYDRYRSQGIAGVVAHSLGGSAVINLLWKTGADLPAVLLAPALNLIAMLKDTFRSYGVPISLFYEIISRIEADLGHDFERENPAALLSEIRSSITIIHDSDDKAVPFFDARAAALVHSNVSLVETGGLGHIRILSDPGVIQKTFEAIDSTGAALISDICTGQPGGVSLPVSAAVL